MYKLKLKRLLSCVLALMLVLGSIPLASIPVHAASSVVASGKLGGHTGWLNYSIIEEDGTEGLILELSGESNGKVYADSLQYLNADIDEYKDEITTIRFNNFTGNSMIGWFMQWTSITKVEGDIAATNMTQAFYGCTNLTEFDSTISNVTNMNHTFDSCTSLTTPPDVPNTVTNIEGIFAGCESLTSLPATVPASVTKASSAFQGCINATGKVQILPNLTTSSSKYIFKETAKDILIEYGTHDGELTRANAIKMCQTAENKNVRVDTTIKVVRQIPTDDAVVDVTEVTLDYTLRQTVGDAFATAEATVVNGYTPTGYVSATLNNDSTVTPGDVSKSFAEMSEYVAPVDNQVWLLNYSQSIAGAVIQILNPDKVVGDEVYDEDSEGHRVAKTNSEGQPIWKKTDDSQFNPRCSVDTGEVIVESDDDGDYVWDDSTETPTKVYGATPVYKTHLENTKQVWVYDGTARRPEVSVTWSDGVHSYTLAEGVDYTIDYANNVNAGQADIILTGLGSYVLTKTVHFTIVPLDLADATITLDHDTFDFTNETKGPDAVTVKYHDNTLTLDDDYTVNITKASAASTYDANVTVTGNGGNTINSKNIPYTIKAMSIETADIVLNHDSFEYDGTSQTPVFNSATIAITHDDGTSEVHTLVRDVDYTLELPEDTTNVGTHNIHLTGIGNFDGTLDVPYSIYAYDINQDNATITYNRSQLQSNIANRFYYISDGKESSDTDNDAVTVKFGETQLERGQDYTVSYGDLTRVGNTTMTLVFKGNFTGTKTYVFPIVYKDGSGNSLGYEEEKETNPAMETVPKPVTDGEGNALWEDSEGNQFVPKHDTMGNVVTGTDKNGNYVLDKDGNKHYDAKPLYVIKTDPESGKQIWKDANGDEFNPKIDPDTGKPVTGTDDIGPYVEDEEGNKHYGAEPVYETVTRQKTEIVVDRDADGNPIPLKDDDGNALWEDANGDTFVPRKNPETGEVVSGTDEKGDYVVDTNGDKHYGSHPAYKTHKQGVTEEVITKAQLNIDRDPDGEDTNISEVIKAQIESRGITDLNIGANITHLDPSVLTESPTLKVVTVNPSNSTFGASGNVLYLKDSDGNLETAYALPKGYVGSPAATTVTFDAGTKHIGDGFMKDNQKITTVTLPNGLLSIGEESFMNTNVATCDIPNTVKSIGDRAFKNSKLTVVTIPMSVTSVGIEAYAHCEALATVNINSNATINKRCFADDNVLVTLAVNGDPAFKTAIFDSANLTTVTVDGHPTTVVGTFTNSGITGELKNVEEDMLIYVGSEYEPVDHLYTVPASITNIGGGAFVDNDEINTVYIKSVAAESFVFGENIVGPADTTDKQVMVVPTKYAAYAEECNNSGREDLIKYVNNKILLAFYVDLRNANYTYSENTFEYTGSEIKPTVTLSFGGNMLTKGVDYSVSYVNNTTPGGIDTDTIHPYTDATAVSDPAIVISNLNPDHIDNVVYHKFEITPYDVALNLDDRITFDESGLTANSHYIAGTGNSTTYDDDVVPSFNGKKLTLGDDYIMEYSNIDTVGVGIVTLKFRGNYKSEKPFYFNIVNKLVSGDNDENSFTLEPVYDDSTDLSTANVIGVKISAEGDLPKNINEIIHNQLEGSGATKVTIGEGLSGITGEAFIGLPITEFVSTTDDFTVDQTSGALIEAATDTLIAYPGGKTDTSVTVPDGVKVIGESAFAGNKHVTEVVLPNTVTTIGKNAFANSKLVDITVPESVTLIKTGAFAGCKDLKARGINPITGALDHGIRIEGSPDVEPGAFTGSGVTGELTNTADTMLIYVGPSVDPDSKQYTVPAKYVKIGGGAFADNTNIDVVYFVADVPPTFNAGIIGPANETTKIIMTNADVVEAYQGAAGLEDYVHYDLVQAWHILVKNVTINLSATDIDYTSEAIKPVTSVTYAGNDLNIAVDGDVTVTYSNNINAGTATATVTGVSKLDQSTKTVEFTISKPSIVAGDYETEDLTPEGGWQVSNTGKLPKPSVTSLTVNGRKLTADTDYTVAYGGNNAPGAANIKVTGINNYTGEFLIPFTVSKTPEVIDDTSSYVADDGKGTYTIPSTSGDGVAAVVDQDTLDEVIAGLHTKEDTDAIADGEDNTNISYRLVFEDSVSDDSAALFGASDTANGLTSLQRFTLYVERKHGDEVTKIYDLGSDLPIKVTPVTPVSTRNIYTLNTLSGTDVLSMQGVFGETISFTTNKLGEFSTAYKAKPAPASGGGSSGGSGSGGPSGGSSSGGGGVAPKPSDDTKKPDSSGSDSSSSGSPEPISAPTMISKVTTHSIALESTDGYVYALSAPKKWQKSAKFTGLKPSTVYSIYFKADGERASSKTYSVIKVKTLDETPKVNNAALYNTEFKRAAFNTGKVTWSKVPDATKYTVAYRKSNKAKWKVVSLSSDKTSYRTPILGLRGVFEVVVRAYTKTNGINELVATSPTLYMVLGSNKSGSNVTKVSVPKSSVSLKKSKTYKIKPKLKYSGKKAYSSANVKSVRYYTTSRKVATVTKKGVITAKGKGSAKIYVMAADGTKAIIKVTVK